MRISNLPPGLRELAEYRRAQANRTGDLVAAAFPWKSTPEGFEFWRSVALGDLFVFNGCRVTNLKMKGDS